MKKTSYKTLRVFVYDKCNIFIYQFYSRNTNKLHGKFSLIDLAGMFTSEISLEISVFSSIIKKTLKRYQSQSLGSSYLPNFPRR